eukprot:TRINITY_DN5403_c0_g1_i1.p1 TRINITY_DN5403_c0_g1~~TRINITY_DN5403_c0_g1_i1.p1  ORF type:complete len:370 (+),score=59.85 TRINITY_DN5403_c0_g1_i1:57-1166(+)
MVIFHNKPTRLRRTSLLVLLALPLLLLVLFPHVPGSSHLVFVSTSGIYSVNAACRKIRCRLTLDCSSDSSSAISSDGSIEENDMAILAQRIEDLKAGRARMPLLVFDSMVPGQQVELWTDDVIFCSLMTSLGVGGVLGVLGLEIRTRAVLRQGTEVMIRAINPRDDGMHVILESGRRFTLPVGSTPASIGRFRADYAKEPNKIGLGWGKEVFVPDPALSKGDSQETGSQSQICSEDDASASTGRAVDDVAWHLEKVEWVPEEVDAEVANPLILELKPLVDEWISLVKSKDRERVEGHLDFVLSKLGPQPPSTKPWSFAFWLAGLINPLPPLGVALEIRPAVLSAQTPEDALDVVCEGLRKSVAGLQALP